MVSKIFFDSLEEKKTNDKDEKEKYKSAELFYLVDIMQRQFPVILTPAKRPPQKHAVSELSSLGQLILASLTSSLVPPSQPSRRVDPSSYYREVYMRQFRAEPEAQPGYTQPYLTQTQADRDQMDCGISVGSLPHASVGKITEGMASTFNNSVYGPDAREQNEADPDPLQQDLSSLFNMDSEYLDLVRLEESCLTCQNDTTAQDKEHLVNKTPLPRFQNKVNERTKLAPSVLNRSSFSKDSCVPTSQHETVTKKNEFYNPTTVMVGSNAPPADLVSPSELARTESHLFDLSLSPILDLSPHEEENTSIPQAQPDSNRNISTKVTSCPETTNEISNVISSSYQKSSHTVQVAIDTVMIKPATLYPHSLQKQQNLFLGDGEVVTHNKKTEDTIDFIINFAKDKVTSAPSPNGILYTDNHKSLIDEHNDRLLNTVGENSKSIVENTELHLRDHLCMNQGINMLSTATDSIFYPDTVDAGQKGKILTDKKHLDPDPSVDPATREGVNKLNTATEVILETEGKSVEIKNPKMNLEVKETWNKSVDIFDISTNVILLNKAIDYTSKEELCTREKDMGLKLRVPQAMNESVDIFNTSSDTTQQPKSRDGRKEEKVCDEIPNNLETSHELTTKPQIFRGSEEHVEIQERAQTPKKPTFRPPLKVVSESPIIGYPLDRRNITSTPKEAQQKKVLRFGSGYSSDSSDTNDRMKHNSYGKAKYFTAKADARAREPSSALCQNLIKKKLEFKPKFMSRLSTLKFSVDHMKKTQNCKQSCLRENNSTENARKLPASSTVESNKSDATAVMNPWNHTKTKNSYENSFTEKTDELENGKSDIMQEINMSAVHSKETANTLDSAGICHKTVDKYTEKLSEFRLNKVKQVDSVLGEDIPGAEEGCSLHKAWEAGKKTSEKANIHVTKYTGAAKSLGKRKSKNQTHMKKKKRRITKSDIQYQANDSSKKTKKRKLKSFSKTTSESQPVSKNKDTMRCLGEDFVVCRDDGCESDREKSRSVKKHSVPEECSESTVNSSQVGLVQQPLGNEAQLLAVSDHLASAQEFCLTLLYRDNSSQLREKVSGGRKQHPGSGQVIGFALRVTWAVDSAPPFAILPTGHHGELSECCGESFSQECAGSRTSYPSNISAVYKVSLGINFNKEEIRSVVSSIMKNEGRKIGFDVQECITFLVEKLEIDHREVISSWVILDPKVGGWLLDSDHPPVTFQQTAVVLKVPLSQAGTGLHPEEEIHSDLKALSIVAAALHIHLVQLNLWTIFLHLEMRITPILAVMELRDIKVDRAILKHMGQRLKLKIEEVERRCHQVSGSVFNAASHAQLRSVLYQELKLDLKARITVPRTTKGQKSTCEAALGRLRDYHPLPGLILQHRLLNKLKTTYVDGILACLHGSSVRAAWEQTSASTGRIQCHHPNLQNIPKQPVIVEVDSNEMIVRARECFCSRKGYVLVSADFQQTELRVLAHLSQDAVLLAGFRQPNHNNTDIFKQLSATWLDKAVSEVTSSERERTKRVVYAVMYGAGKEKLSEVLHIKQSEANDIISSFMKHFPGIPTYMRSVIEVCQQQGFLTTIFRRRRSFPGITSHDPTVKSQAERQAVNFIIQGSAADLSKAAMVQTEVALARCPEIDAKLLIHIHDELLWEVCTEHSQSFCDVVGRIMEDTQQLCGPLVQLTVPLPITVSIGTSWAHMQPHNSTISSEAS